MDEPSAVVVGIDVSKDRLDVYLRPTDEAFCVPREGLSGILCAGPVDHHARMNLSSNMMANWVFASPHSRGDIFHSVAV